METKPAVAGERSPAALPKSKRSEMLIRQLERDHNFSIVPKIIKLYGDTEKLYQPLLLKVEENILKGLPMTARLDEAELELFNATRKDLWTILSSLLSYCYPRLKALEVKSTDTEKVTFNINIPKVKEGNDYSVELDRVSLRASTEEE